MRLHVQEACQGVNPPMQLSMGQTEHHLVPSSHCVHTPARRGMGVRGSLIIKVKVWEGSSLVVKVKACKVITVMPSSSLPLSGLRSGNTRAWQVTVCAACSIALGVVACMHASVRQECSPLPAALKNISHCLPLLAIACSCLPLLACAAAAAHHAASDCCALSR